MRWVQCFLLPDIDYVKYTTDILTPETASLPYKEFLEFIFTTTVIVYREKFMQQLNSYQTIILDNNTGKWDIISPPQTDLSQYGLEEMLALKQKRDIKKEDEKKSKVQRLLDKADNLFDRLSKARFK